MFDLILKNGLIIDGSGSAGYQSDIGIKAGEIAAIGSLKNAQSIKEINCTDYIVAPGFIDLHSHSDLQIFNHKVEKILQGVTTEVVGNCGFSAFPVEPETFRLSENFSSPILGEFNKEWKWNDAGSYFGEMEKNKLVLNAASLVGHGTLRISVMGLSMQPPDSSQLKQMKKKLEEEIDAGAVGFSSGLEYSPGSYSNKEELIELNKTLKGKNKFYASHMRNYSSGVIESVDETIEVGRQAETPVQISHMQAVGPANRDKLDSALELVTRASDSGLDISMDAYPFLAGSTVLTQILPQWMLEGGIGKMLDRINNGSIRIRAEKETKDNLEVRWEDLYISSVESKTNRRFIGKNIVEISEMKNTEPVGVVFDLLTEEKGNVMIISFNQPEENLIKILQYPKTMVITDGLFSKGLAHPRLYSTYPTFIHRYVKELNIMPLEEAIMRITSLPAKRLGMKEIGIIGKGKKADLTIFDFDNYKSGATYTKPEVKPSGIKYVLLDGNIVVKNGDYTGGLFGKVLKN